MPNDVRDRSREILRAELADAAASFCAEHGFDEVTTDEIARGIGVSRATFFRYFTSKEDAVVSAAHGSAARAGTFAQRVAEVADAAEPGTTVWAIIRTATQSMIDTAETRGDPLRARIRMITDVPALKGQLASQRSIDQSAVTDVLRGRLDNDRTARAAAAAGVAAVDLAWQEWARTPGSKLRPLLDAYLTALGNVAAAKLT
ncbi:TetR/AcrR family transcriptional regulator [Microlunatus soli]|uniref:DNA-binding transcriptional regulator, AcrR family n=1 Tax=Microlunatus soli TaxID=630515 RepID=A0A1H1V0J5_9ACTN|nr:TetR family transcriptional regulator [Microlunatus soli]SDS78314.1 DNA-binding transcriptional regulator, AcrR family [Microlunatus soli]